MRKVPPTLPKPRFRFFPQAALALVLAVAVAGCSGSGTQSTAAGDDTPNVSAADGRYDYRGGISLNNLFQAPQGGGGLPVNALLWRASLDTVSVIPLASVDTFGGAIISEWYTNPDDPNKRIKVSVFVLDQELRSDGIKAEVHVQERANSTSAWVDAGRDKELAVRLEELILTRAREIRSSGISETN